MADRPARLTPFVDGAIHVTDYPVQYWGIRFLARTTVVRLANGGLWIHSPGEIDDALKAEIDALGPVRFIVGPGNFHWLHLGAARRRFPGAETHICPGIERKDPTLGFDWLLGDRPPEAWAAEIDQVLLRGTRFIWEVAFLHKPTRTLILTDLIENIGDSTPGVGIILRIWWKGILFKWNRPGPAPEYDIGWKNKKAVRASLEKIMAWDFDRVIMSHGDLISANAKDVVREAWRKPLAF